MKSTGTPRTTRKMGRKSNWKRRAEAHRQQMRENRRRNCNGRFFRGLVVVMGHEAR